MTLPGSQINVPTSRHIPLWGRWGILLLSLLIAFNVFRYPFAAQNFMRADGLLALELYDKAITQYNRAILLYPEFDQAYSMLAWTYEKENNPVRARQVFDKGFPHRHYDEQYYLDYTVLLWKLKDTRKAIEVSRKGYEQFPQSRNMMRIYGHSLEQAGQQEEARSLWLQYLRLFPDDDIIRHKIR